MACKYAQQGANQTECAFKEMCVHQGVGGWLHTCSAPLQVKAPEVALNNCSFCGIAPPAKTADAESAAMACDICHAGFFI